MGSEARLLSALKEIPSLPSSSGHRLGMETSGKEPGKEKRRRRNESMDREIRVYSRVVRGTEMEKRDRMESDGKRHER